MAHLQSKQIAQLAHDLSSVESLRLPAKMAQDGFSEKDKITYLSALLQHDPGVFLERHGALLSKHQRAFFEPLREDYEVNFYMMLLEDKEKAQQSPDETMDDSEEKSLVSATAKNRRLAKMARLEKEGYFEEEASRKRAPLLHHQYLGQYAPPRAPINASTLSDQIIQQHEERQIAETMAKQQKMEDQAGANFEATLSESESEEDSEDEDMKVTIKPGHEPKTGNPISSEELAQNQIDFKALMEVRFLNGEDGGADADKESELDEDWAKERQQDLEDTYFDA